MNGSLLIVGVIAVWIILVIPGWSSAARNCGSVYRTLLWKLMERF